MSVRNYHYTLRNVSEERRPQIIPRVIINRTAVSDRTEVDGRKNKQAADKIDIYAAMRVHFSHFVQGIHKKLSFVDFISSFLFSNLVAG
jgi:hypothetical protein